MMTFLVKKYTFLLLSLIFISTSAASDNINTIRLKSMIRTDYPEYIDNVHTLMRYILTGTKYRIYTGVNAPSDSDNILSSELPRQHNNLLLSRLDALLMAVGKQNAIVLDHENKLVSVTRSEVDNE